LSSDGESGHASHRQQIADYQEENRESILALYRLANRERPIDDLKFHPLDEPSGKEAAETAKTNAESDKIYIETGVLTPKDVAKARFSDEEGELEVEDLESVPDEHATAEQTNGAGSVEGEGGDPEGAQVA
jgi:hypothetical protein